MSILKVALTLALYIHLVQAVPGDTCHPITNPCRPGSDTECVFDQVENNYICTCNNGLITDVANNRCLLEPVRPTDPCAPRIPGACTPVPNSECIKNGFPTESCYCTTGFAELPLKCLQQPVDLGDECHVTLATCPLVDGIQLICNGTICQCPLNLIPDFPAKKCLQLPVNPGDDCHPLLTPCTSIPNTICLLGQCQCMAGYIQDGIICLRIPTAPGEVCHPTLTPCPTGTNCQDPENDGSFACICEGDFVTDPAGKKCLVRPSLPGDECHASLTPCDGIPETECHESGDGIFICKCIGIFVNHPIESRCVRKPTEPSDECLPIQAPCTYVTGTECLRDSGNPIYFNCTCLNGMVTDPVHKRCIPVPRFPGDACVKTLSPCLLVQNTTCDDDPVKKTHCRCTTAFFTDYQGRRCLKHPTRPGQRCHQGMTDCSLVAPETTTCTAKENYYYCSCEHGFVTDEVDERCIRIPGKPGDLCHVDLAPCNGVNDTSCIEVDGSFTCTCNDPYITDPVRGRCLLTPTKPGDLCDPDFSPCLDVEGTNCEHPTGYPDYSCRCIDGQHTDPDNGICIPPPDNPGDPCHEIEAPCQHPDTTCVDFVCTCDDPLITDPTNGRCLLTPVLPGDDCDPIVAPCHNVQLTECLTDNGQDYYCKCHPEYVNWGQTCQRKPIKPGDACVIGLAPCDGIPETSCVDDGDGFYCKCDGDLITDDGLCFMRPQRPSDRCSLRFAPCNFVAGTNCEVLSDGHFCLCDSVTQFTDFIHRECVPHPSNVRDRCDSNSSQTCRPVPHTICQLVINNMYFCMCDVAYFEDLTCHPVPTKPYDRCLIQDHCLGIPFTDCTLDHAVLVKKCQCIFGYVLSADSFSCIKKPVYLNDTCEMHSHCDDIENSLCEEDQFRYGFCKCRVGYVSSANRTRCLRIVPILGQTCVEDVQCLAGIGAGALCNQVSECSCEADFVESDALDKCLQKSYLGEECQESRQCTATSGTLGECFDDICRCKFNAGEYRGKCYYKVPLHGPCSESPECIVGIDENSECYANFCRCTSRAIEWKGGCFDDLNIGDDCNSDLDCTVPIQGDVICDRRNKTCTCNVGRRPLGPKFCASIGSNSVGTVAVYYAILSLVFIDVFSHR